MMRVPYQCCRKSFEEYYTQQTGRGLNFYQGVPYQKGYGLGGLFRSFFRAAVPLLKSGAKAVGKQLWDSGLNIAGDISRGDDVKLAAKRRLKEAGKVLADQTAAKVKSMIGKGNKKRKRVKNNISSRCAKKQKVHDIFS